MFIDMLTGKRIVIILISLCLIVSCGRHPARVAALFYRV